jgi:hypothetical protein
MVLTVPAALKHINADLAHLLDAPAIVAVCRAIG